MTQHRIPNNFLVFINYSLFTICYLLFFSGCTEFNPVTEKQEMILYSTDREVDIGRNLARYVDKEYEAIKDPRVIERITTIADKVTAACDRQDINYQVTAIKAKKEEKEESADINAFALPGGYIYVFDGLVNFADNDDQIACVIAHEVGHIVAKHSIKKLQAAMGYNLLSLAAIGTGQSSVVGSLQYAFVTLMLGYSREDELLADRLGARYAKKAGYNPRAMIDFLVKLREKERKDPLRPKSEYRTHPYIADRIVEVKRELGEPLTFSEYVNASDVGK